MNVVSVTHFPTAGRLPHHGNAPPPQVPSSPCTWRWNITTFEVLCPLWGPESFLLWLTQTLMMRNSLFKATRCFKGHFIFMQWLNWNFTLLIHLTFILKGKDIVMVSWWEMIYLTFLLFPQISLWLLNLLLTYFFPNSDGKISSCGFQCLKFLGLIPCHWSAVGKPCLATHSYFPFNHGWLSIC